jgi:hypothetical protein
MINPLRFTIRTWFLVLFAIGICLALVLPPRVHFANPRFTAFPGTTTFSGPIPTSVVVRMSLTNQGILPIWYQSDSDSQFAMGALPSTFTAVIPDGEKIEWRKLNSGDTIELREYNIGADDKAGARLRNWIGLEFICVAPGIDFSSAYENRESLSPEFDSNH